MAPLNGNLLESNLLSIESQNELSLHCHYSGMSYYFLKDSWNFHMFIYYNMKYYFQEKLSEKKNGKMS